MFTIKCWLHLAKVVTLCLVDNTIICDRDVMFKESMGAYIFGGRGCNIGPMFPIVVGLNNLYTFGVIECLCA